MKYGCISRFSAGIVGMVAVLLALGSCGRERVNPIDPSFDGSEALSPPGNIQATGDIEQITLRWNAVNLSNLAGYGIWRSTSATEGYVRLTGDSRDAEVTTARTTFVDTALDLTQSKIYFYKINTVDTSGRSSELSTFVSGEAQEDARPPAAPTDLSAVTDVNTGRVALNWTAPQTDAGNLPLTGLSEYKIFRSKDSQNAFVLIATISADATTYEDADQLEVSAQYFYRVSAADPAGNVGPRSALASASVTDRGLIAPRNPVAVAGVQKITLSWTANAEPELTGYEILRFTDPAQATPDATFNSVLTTFVDTPVVAGQTYVYRVRALGRQGLQSELSNFVSAQAEAPRPVLSVPRNVQAIGGIGRVTLSWTPNAEPELTGYRVLRYSDPSETTAEATFPTVQTTFVDSPLAAGRTVVYRVQAVGAGGVQSDLSLFASATVQVDDSPPAAPGNFAAVLRGTTTIELLWSAPTRDNNGGALTGLSGFVIYRAVGTAGAGFTELARVDSTRRVFENGGLAFNTTYLYQIAAVDARGNESPRSSVTLRTAAIVPPSNLTASYVGAVVPPRVALSWTSPAEFDSFLIQRAVVVVGSSALTFTTLQQAQLGTTYNDTDLQSGTTYVYRVSTNRSGQISDPSSATIIQIP